MFLSLYSSGLLYNVALFGNEEILIMTSNELYYFLAQP